MLDRRCLRIVFAVVACLLWPSRGDSNQEKARLTLPAEWAAGTKYSLHVTSERIDLIEGKQNPRGGTTTTVEVTVKEKTKEGYLYEWRYADVSVNLAQSPQQRLLERLATMTKGFVFRIDTGSGCNPSRIENLAEVVKLTEAGLAEIKESLTSSGTSLPAGTLEQLATPAVVQQSALKWPGIYYLTCGASLFIGEASEYEDQLPNPFGGQPLPAKGKFLAVGVRAAQREAEITWLQTLDKEKSRSFLVDALQRLAPDAFAKLKESEFPPVQIEDAAQYVVDLKSGLVKSVVHTRTTSISDRGRIDRITIQARLPE